MGCPCSRKDPLAELLVEHEGVLPVMPEASCSSYVVTRIGSRRTWPRGLWAARDVVVFWFGGRSPVAVSCVVTAAPSSCVLVGAGAGIVGSRRCYCLMWRWPGGSTWWR